MSFDNPLQVVDDIFNKHINNVSHESLQEGSDWGIPAHFDKWLNENNNIDKVCINNYQQDILKHLSIIYLF